MKTRFRPWTSIVCVLVAAMGVSAHAATVTWTGTADKDWFNQGNWDTATVPGPGDAVVIATGTVALSNATPSLASLTLAGTLSFTNWSTVLNATNVVISSGGRMTHVLCDTNVALANTNRVYVNCSNLTIEAGGEIDAEGLGHRGPPGGVIAWGQGPGGGYDGQGGGYGGVSGHARYGTGGGVTYGSASAPIAPGSGGGVHSSFVGWAGGGAVRIVASGTVTIEGAIDCDGAGTGSYTQSGGGSGGAVYITCRDLAGSNGVIRANGGSAINSGGGGGGGRIAVLYSNSDYFYGQRAVAGGIGYADGSPGTIYRECIGGGRSLAIVGDPVDYGLAAPYPYGYAAIGAGMVVTDNVPATVPASVGTRRGCTGWEVVTGSVTYASGSTTQAVFTMPDEDATLTWAWTNQFLLTASAGPGGTVNMGVNGYYTHGTITQVSATATGSYSFMTWSGDMPFGAHSNNPAPVTMDQPRTVQANFADSVGLTRTWTGVGEWFSVTNWSPAGAPGPLDDAVVGPGSVCLCFPTEVADLTVSNSATVVFTNWMTELTAHDVTVMGNALVTHAACNTNPVVSNTNRVWLTCNSVTVLSTGKISGDYMGFEGATPAAAADTIGQGPSAARGGDGAGYGGHGGRGKYGAFGSGSTYGSSNAPVQAGSGGGSHNNAASYDGGGAIRIVAAQTVTVDGTISCRGQGTTGGSQGGAGSGGSISVTCSDFLGGGAGLVSVDGGSMVGLQGGGGGGGRIAVHYENSQNFSGALSAQGGIGYGTGGSNGTIHAESFGVNPMFTVTGTPGEYGTATPYAYGQLAVAAGTSITDSVPLQVVAAPGVKWGCTGWRATTGSVSLADGISTQAVFTMVSEDTTLTWLWTNLYELTVAAAPGGTANTGASGYYTNGVSVPLTAVATGTYSFLRWSGDLPLAARTSNPAAVTMDRARLVQANFESSVATSRVWTGNGEWFSMTNWSPLGAPGAQDDVLLGGGSILLRDPIAVQDLAVSNSATLMFSNWTTRLAAHDVSVLANGTITHAACDTNAAAGNTSRVWIVCHNLTVASGGSVSGDARGYLASPGQSVIDTWGQGPGAGRGSGGAGYGGVGTVGQYSGLAGATYGLSNAPVQPGSGGGAHATYAGWAGGGAVHLEVSRTLRVDGAVSVKGGGSTTQNMQGGAGSGGSIHIACITLDGGVGGEISAEGGNGGSGSPPYGGAGGGGRIAILRARHDFAGALTVAGGVGRYTAAAGTIVLTSPPQSTVFLIR